MDFLDAAIMALTTAREFLRSNGIVPLTLQNWSTMLTYWKYFTIVGPVQLTLDWYPMGKTSLPSLFNLPGKPAWICMELVSPMALLCTIYTNSTRTPGALLPKSHLLLTTLFCMHYFHRALLSPLRNPSMGPTHVLIPLMAVAFNLVNGSAIGGWLGGYGSAEEVPVWQVAIGTLMFLIGLWGNVYHEEILRDLRRETTEMKKGAVEDGEVFVMDGRVYKVPHGGLFSYCWYPHYLSEWFEWIGFMVAGGGPVNFLPATLFVVNEFAAMTPRAIQGKRWYLKKFGDKVPKRAAVIPGVL